MAVGVQEPFQFVDLGLKLAPLVGVAHALAVVRQLYDLRGADDVVGRCDGFLRGGERFVLDQLESAGVVDKGVSGYAGGAVIGLGEPSVNYQQTPVGPDGTLPVADFGR